MDGRFHILDGMRGIAAISVVGLHFGLEKGNGGMFPEAYLAVDFFFMLSGFVLGRIYEGRLQAGLSPFSFFHLRVARLYPSIAVGAGLGVVTLLVQTILHAPNALSWPEFMISAITNAVMLPSPVTKALYPLNDPAWSLLLEFLVNIAFALWLCRLRTASLVAFCLVMGAALALATCVYGLGSLGVQWPSLIPGIFRVSYGFSLGLLAARWFENRRPKKNLGLLSIALLGAILCVNPGLAWRNVYDLSAVAIAFPTILWVGANSSAPRWAVPFCWFMGVTSYPLYATHYNAQKMLHFAVARLGFPPAMLLVTFLAVAIPAAWVVAVFVEPPMQAWLARKLYVVKEVPVT